MRYIICYDVTDDRRRSHLANILLDFGRRLQESVFAADLDADLHAKMWERIRQTVSQDDRLCVFSICGACEKLVQTIGSDQGLREPKYYVI